MNEITLSRLLKTFDQHYTQTRTSTKLNIDGHIINVVACYADKSEITFRIRLKTTGADYINTVCDLSELKLNRNEIMLDKNSRKNQNIIMRFKRARTKLMPRCKECAIIIDGHNAIQVYMRNKEIIKGYAECIYTHHALNRNPESIAEYQTAVNKMAEHIDIEKYFHEKIKDGRYAI